MLILLGEQLKPDEVTQQLELQPWQSWRRGERRFLSPADESVHLWGGWKRKMNEEWGNVLLEDHLERWYELLYPKRKILREFAKQGFTARLDCLLFAQSVVTVAFNWELQRKMVRIGVDVTLCIYPPESVAI